MPTRPNATDCISPLDETGPDDALIVAASWEERCLGVPQRLSPDYSCKIVLLTVYDGPSELREKHLATMRPLLHRVGVVKEIATERTNAIPSVRTAIAHLRQVSPDRMPRITFDVSTFTTKHFLQTLLGLDLAGVLGSCQFFYTEPTDFRTLDDAPISQGISSVTTIVGFGGRNRPSCDVHLVLFLGYEGRRALALWEHVEPNITTAIIPDPPTHSNWHGRTEVQNRYLLTSLQHGQVQRSDALVPASTERLLDGLIGNAEGCSPAYNIRIAPLGTKAQTLGIYTWWRTRRASATIMYASPVKYRQEHASFPSGPTWMIDRTESWRSER